MSGEGDPPPAVPDPAEWNAREAARQEDAARAMRGALAATLVLEALTVILIPRTVARLDDGLSTTGLVVLLCLAGVLVVAAFLLRRPWGIAVGSVLQVAVLACGLFTGAMFVLGVIFGLIWLYELRLRRELLTPRPPPTTDSG